MIRALLPLAALALTAAAPVPAPLWTLQGDGLSRTVSGKATVLRFGTPKAKAIAAVTAVLGKPIETRNSSDCGQGIPMTMVDYKGGLTIQFLHGKFSGWSIEAPFDARFKTARGITIGSTRAEVMKAYPDADVDDGSLGVMFTREDGPSGFLDSSMSNARVTGLYAGETCMVS